MASGQMIVIVANPALGSGKLVLFDLDGTLVDRDHAFRAWAGEFAAACGLTDRQLTWLIFAGAHHPGPMERFFADVRDELGLAEPAGEIWRQYRRRMPALITAVPGSRAALARLRQAGWRTGIVTSGMADNQVGKIRATGLDRLADGWCVSAEAGIRKPDPEIFHLTARRCGLPDASGGWMVGDSLPLDIAGGHQAGMRTIWITSASLAQMASQHGPGFFTGLPPDQIATSIRSAARIILGH